MNSTSKIPSGITNDINSTPISKDTSSSFFGSSSASSSPSSESISSSKNGFFTTDGKTNYIKIGLVVIILLFFGVNIFSYLGDFLQKLKEIAAPFFKDILESLGYAVTETTKDVTNIAAKGAKLGIDVAAGTVESGVDVIQGQLDLEQSGNSSQQQQSSKSSTSISASLTSALANAEENTEPLPDDAMSSTQRNGTGKSGYCYIGEDRGFRSCISVSENDTCMSGDIFPSQEICVNPSLRE
jgi:hypothetical protein